MRFTILLESLGGESWLHPSGGKGIAMSNLLWWPKPPGILSYGVAVLSVTAALIIARWLDIHLVTAPVSLFLCAIMFSAWFGGIRPGLLAVALSHLAFIYYFVTPLYSLAVEIKEVPRLIIFALSALFVGSLSAAQRSATESLRSARDDLSRTVQELRRTNEALKAENAEREQAEEALHKAQAELAHITRVTTLGELTASIAHEVNQPLSAIVTNASACLRWLAGESPNLDEAREAARRIIREGQRAGEVITRIRAMLQKTDTQKARLDINDTIRDIVALAQSEVSRNRVTLRMELAADLPPVWGDRVQLQQVMLNLLMNGVEAMAAVNDRPRELRIQSRSHESDKVLIAVQDSGIGLDRENLEKIFDAFYTTKPQGMGMGLVISRSIVENHGGRLWAESNESPGVTFQFTLLKSDSRTQHA
jgi:C4-dicarboxylate-specific signal transduction histidine kinase